MVRVGWRTEALKTCLERSVTDRGMGVGVGAPGVTKEIVLPQPAAWDTPGECHPVTLLFRGNAVRKLCRASLFLKNKKAALMRAQGISNRFSLTRMVVVTYGIKLLTELETPPQKKVVKTWSCAATVLSFCLTESFLR